MSKFTQFYSKQTTGPFRLAIRTHKALTAEVVSAPVEIQASPNSSSSLAHESPTHTCNYTTNFRQVSVGITTQHPKADPSNLRFYQHI